MIGDRRQYDVEPAADEAAMIEKSKQLAAWAGECGVVCSVT